MFCTRRLDYWYVLYHYYDSIIIDYGKVCAKLSQAVGYVSTPLRRTHPSFLPFLVLYSQQMSYKLTNKTRTCEAAPLNGTEMGKFTFVNPEAYWIGRSVSIVPVMFFKKIVIYLFIYLFIYLIIRFCFAIFLFMT
jgi:hypothetical protein